MSNKTLFMLLSESHFQYRKVIRKVIFDTDIFRMALGGNMPNLLQFRTLVCKKEQAMLTVELNRPDRLNAFNEMMFGDVARIAEIASRDPEVWVVVFKGRGRAFSSGADLTELSGGIKEIDADTLVQQIKAAQQVMDRVEAISQPTIAAIHGPAVRAGFQLALACDFRIAVKRYISS